MCVYYILITSEWTPDYGPKETIAEVLYCTCIITIQVYIGSAEGWIQDRLYI